MQQNPFGHFSLPNWEDVDWLVAVFCEAGLCDWHSPSCVMQMEPLPMPTLRPSTPASIRFLACAAVTTGERGIEREREVYIYIERERYIYI